MADEFTKNILKDIEANLSEQISKALSGVTADDLQTARDYLATLQAIKEVTAELNGGPTEQDMEDAKNHLATLQAIRDASASEAINREIDAALDAMPVTPRHA